MDAREDALQSALRPKLAKNDQIPSSGPIEKAVLPACRPPDAFRYVLLSEFGVQGTEVVAEFGVEEAAAAMFAEPCGGVVLAHRFAAVGFKVVADGYVSRFIDAKQYLDSGQAGDAAVVVCPIRRVGKLTIETLHRWMVFVGLVNDNLCLHEVRVAVEIATGEVREPFPFRLMHQGGVQSDQAATALVPILDGLALLLVEQVGQGVGIIEDEDLVPF